MIYYKNDFDSTWKHVFNFTVGYPNCGLREKHVRIGVETRVRLRRISGIYIITSNRRGCLAYTRRLCMRISYRTAALSHWRWKPTTIIILWRMTWIYNIKITSQYYVITIISYHTSSPASCLIISKPSWRDLFRTTLHHVNIVILYMLYYIYASACVGGTSGFKMKTSI